MGHYTASMKRVKGIAERMEGRMGWTREKPTKAGWYWWRRDSVQDPCVLHVQIFRGQWWVPHYDALHNGGEWQGPITPEE